VFFFLFAVFYGMTLTVATDRDIDTNDAVSHRKTFERIAIYNNNMNLDDIDFETQKDIFLVSTMILSAKVTDNYHVLFMVYAAIFAFFMLKAFNFLTREKKFDNTLSSFLLAALFVIGNTIVAVAGVRFQICIWIGVYCIFQIFVNDKKKYFLLACLMPFIHFSFLFYVFVILIAYFFKKYNKFWIVLFFTSFAVGEASFLIVDSIEPYLSSRLQAVSSSYTSEEYIADRAAASSIIQQSFKMIVRLYVNLAVILFFNNRLKIKETKAHNLYLFLIVFMTFVNFFMIVPHLGFRYQFISFPIIAYIWLIVFKDVKNKPVLYAFPFVFAYNIYKVGFGYFHTHDIMFNISSPILLVYQYLIVY
jgi:hypothetical protein